MTTRQEVRAVGGRFGRAARRRLVALAPGQPRRSRRPGGALTGSDNLVDPVFVLCSPRSGSTLLRVILGTHSQILAPRELHLRDAQVRSATPYAARTWKGLGFTPRDLEDLLWDRTLHLLLVSSGKSIIVDKTPQNVLDWKRIARKWPKARYIHLRRHPWRIVESRSASRPDQTLAFHIRRTAAYGKKLDAARDALPGPTVRYEDLTTDPARQVQRVCDYLGVAWEPAMLAYGQDDFVKGWGDWSDKIHSGKIHPSPPAPPIGEVPVDLRGLAISWGYGEVGGPSDGR